MLLSDRDIIHALETGRIKIDPPPDLATQLGSVSIDFRLGHTFMVFEHSRHSYIDPRQPQSIGDAMRTIVVGDDEPFIMQPGDFALASTIESLELPDDLVGRLEGRVQHCPARYHGALHRRGVRAWLGSAPPRWS
ncbi:MAG: hypothetical protein KatS3mg059_0398 [Thermomicrobiales bacterium]|nr:MAG: hypothetical protein KatS3mg059_0398 [Thermomicrobiales bacterium]